MSINVRTLRGCWLAHSATCVVLLCLMQPAAAQPPKLDSTKHRGYVDFHTHLTSKHYYRDTHDPWECMDTILPDRLKQVNWIPVRRKARAYAKAKPSLYNNYYQANYSELRNVPGSILCNCIYPYEKHLTIRRSKRWLSAIAVTQIRRKRLYRISKKENSPWREFLGEYAFATKGRSADPEGGLRIRYPKDGADLAAHLDDSGTINALFTIEGAQVFYDTYASYKDRIRGALCDAACQREIIARVDSLRSLEHRIFFIAPGHFVDNHVAGFCKTLDRKGFTRRAVSTAAGMPTFYRSLFNKHGEGIHGELDTGQFEKVPGTQVALPFTLPRDTNTLGWRVIERLLRPGPAGGHKEPVYIDMKHLDVQGRLEFYARRRRLMTESNLTELPIIASHIAASGEDTCIAKATGLNPLFDRYPEVRNPRRFYEEQRDDYDAYWRTRNGFLGELPLNPFEDHINYRTVGWFYPWSINLANEEFIEIHESDGIMGLMLDGRQLGKDMPNYTRKYWKDLRCRLYKSHAATNYGLGCNEWSDFQEMVPLMRNILYIVEHCGRGTPCWEHLSIGSDMDGLIQPLKVCRTTEDIPKLKELLIRYLPLFTELEGSSSVWNGVAPAEAMNKLFYDNGRRFILKYY